MIDGFEIVEVIAIAGLSAGWYLEHRHSQRMKIDPTYGIYTRIAVEAKPPKSGSIIFWDIDDMRTLNQKWTYEGTDIKIRAATKSLQISRDCHLIARWYSGDEFIYNCPQEDAVGTAERIQSLFQQQGISITLGIASILDEDWRGAIRAASSAVQAAKSSGQHGKIIICDQ